ncbi:hypothetical protein QR680_008108 [Steinernema hermaphroditum]|uniref:DNA-directed DNA polymerase n=1 Tax=Steinernema hermaphroditum TaxID=289476 RepID=A0AA39IFF5_9BILA|nr:hypothetical protein QR680_008108 [Steinernema hermaphroditum]
MTLTFQDNQTDPSSIDSEQNVHFMKLCRSCSNACWVSKSADPEFLFYFDVTSLYPYILMSGIFPCGSPVVKRDDFPADITADILMNSMKGLIYCEVDPPRGLLHPVLPFKKEGGSLQFALCAKCATERNQQKPCTCSLEERRLTGTWTHMELAKAVSLGYKVHRIFETWTWTTWKDDLFVEYIKEFLKIKQEASGWPRSNMTDEEKDAYLQECEDKMGVRLDREKVIYNPGLRHLAKLALNSFWGKWGQRGNLVSTQFVSTAEEIWSIIRDDRLDLLSVTNITEDLCMITYRKKEGIVSSTVLLQKKTTACLSGTRVTFSLRLLKLIVMSWKMERQR